MQCAQCKTKINNNQTIYRSCDATVCSFRCGHQRLKHIKEGDRKMAYPAFWDTHLSMDVPVGLEYEKSSCHLNEYLESNNNSNNNINTGTNTGTNTNNNIEKKLINCTILIILGIYIKNQIYLSNS